MANPLPLMSSKIGDPPQVSHPKQVQFRKSKSPPNMKHLLMKVVLHDPLQELQHSPVEGSRVVHGGHEPLKPGVVQFPPVAGGMLHVCRNSNWLFHF